MAAARRRKPNPEHLAHRAEERAAERSLAQVISIRQARGDTVVRQGRGAVNIPSSDGLLWLRHKGRISVTQNLAAEHYRRRYERLPAGSVRSGLDFAARGEQSEGAAFLQARAREEIHGERGAHAAVRAAAARQGYGKGVSRIVADLEAVIGEGRTFRELTGGRKEAAATRERYVLWALDVLAGHWGVG